MVTIIEFYMDIGIFNVNHCRVIYRYMYIMDINI